MTERDNWASPAELAEAIKSGEAGVLKALKGSKKKNPAPALTTSRVMADAWDKFSAEVMPLSITPEQEKWAKRLFMAGAMTLMGNLLYSDVLDEHSDGATSQDINRVDALHHELNAFFSAIGELQ